MVASPENFPLLKELLAEQQRLDTPVARFSGVHASLEAAGPALAPVYRDLIPLSSPRPGEQYAFEVALDSCTGCKACVSACHSLNGLDETEAWRDVGLIVGGEERHPFQQTVTTACHHCADPACLNGCPVLAYEKDPVTGIVRHLDDQCIGCQYCVLKCPYDVPKYNARLGIVRKCDMCQSRLAGGEAPACVQACPTHAIRIVTVAVKPVAPPASFTYYVKPAGAPATPGVDTSWFLAVAPDPAYTQPTTRYLSRKPLPLALAAADAHTLRPQPAHWPLVIMLTLLPLAIGAQLAACLLATSTGGSGSPGTDPFLETSFQAPAWNDTYYVSLLGWVAGAMGLAASVAHLGQPLRAWRIFLGWRTSWLSREAMVFGAWFAASSAAAALHVKTIVDWLHPVTRIAGATITELEHQLLWASAVLGLAGLFCSVMIYVDTRRVFWRLSQTGPRFFGSVWILGSGAWFALSPEPAVGMWLLAAGTLTKLAFELRAVRPAGEAEDDALPAPQLNTARILLGPLAGAWGFRFVAAIVCSVLLPAMVVAGVIPAGGRWIILAGVLGGELMERYLFFRAVDAPKMPGLPAGFGKTAGQHR